MWKVKLLQPICIKVIYDIVSFEGHETIATTLSFLFVEVGQNRDIYHK